MRPSLFHFVNLQSMERKPEVGPDRTNVGRLFVIACVRTHDFYVVALLEIVKISIAKSVNLNQSLNQSLIRPLGVHIKPKLSSPIRSTVAWMRIFSPSIFSRSLIPWRAQKIASNEPMVYAGSLLPGSVLKCTGSGGGAGASVAGGVEETGSVVRATSSFALGGAGGVSLDVGCPVPFGVKEG